MTEHLIHIGYAKTGSTLLQQWFAAHPELAYAEGGIAGFNDVYGIVRAGATQQELPRYWVTSSEALSTPNASEGLGGLVDYGAPRQSSMPDAQRHACRLLSRLFPGAHVLIVTRGYRSIIMSGYSQYVRRGGNKSLAELCRQTPPTNDGIVQWHYDFLVAEYRDAFGHERVTVLPYELLKESPAAFLNAITTRLGVREIDPPAGRPNPSLSPVELAWYPELTKAVSALPETDGVRQTAMEEHLRALNDNRLKDTVEQLQRSQPRDPVTSKLITDEVLKPFRGFADGLGDDPLYHPYAREYLFSR
jgi:DNA-binding transcriptional ArsR family regulator